MWSRKELKRKAKRVLTVNYWRMVLVAFIMALITGGVATGTYKFSNKDIGFKGVSDNKQGDEIKWQEFKDDLQAASDAVEEAVETRLEDEETVAALVVFLIIFLVALLIGFVVAAGISIFLKNPLVVGANGFFISNADGEGELSNLGLAFRSNYKQIVLGMFLKGAFSFLWSLLLIVPGIIKAYEYRMIPYILADNPEIKQRDAFELSKKMMYGNKWRAFVLDLSFIGWQFLNLITIGILGIFYVNPFKMQTDANLYLALKGDVAGKETVVYDNYVEML